VPQDSLSDRVSTEAAPYSTDCADSRTERPGGGQREMVPAKGLGPSSRDVDQLVCAHGGCEDREHATAIAGKP
jgi:hypothetical protein